jgi:drug/metabolite transporter (DMT)-like permease
MIPPATDAAAQADGRRRANQAYAFLAFTMTCWAGNAVAGRLAVGEISPMVVTCFRWGIVMALLLGVPRRQWLDAWPELRRHRGRIVFMAVCGFSAFNALFYIAAHHTTAVNIAILQGAIPVFVVIGAALLHGVRIVGLQAVGILATLVGVAVVATEGHLGTLAAFRMNLGDGLMLLACFLHAAYTLALRHRPNVPGLILFAAMAVIAFVTSLPLLAYEVVAGTVLWPTSEGWMLLLFISIFPSFLAQLAYMRGVDLIGPGRAGLFANLVPIFGAFLAVLILGELFGLYHFAALVLVIGGILIAETAGRRRAGLLPRDDASHSAAAIEKAVRSDRRGE